MMILFIAIVIVVIAITIVAILKSHKNYKALQTNASFAQELSSILAEEAAAKKAEEEKAVMIEAAEKKIKTKYKAYSGKHCYDMRRKDARWMYGHHGVHGVHDYKYKDKRVDNGKRYYDPSWEEI